MCTFNRDDTHLLCSGLDDHVLQFDLRRPPINTPTVPPSSSSLLLRMDIRALHSRTNYRRSVYLADGKHLITAGTDEDYYRIMNVHDGSDKGIVPLSGLLSTPPTTATSSSSSHLSSPTNNNDSRCLNSSIAYNNHTTPYRMWSRMLNSILIPRVRRVPYHFLEDVLNLRPNIIMH
ncbi:hypothetical protein FOZ62_011013 [Perkinsus olseni]|uniref:Uncharacterized protein n=1 Tax=Perkinsus olseni TaxID=32597 RepID=A0A7J6SCY8_PEROL|nr:hypothetical protein FOZ62_011013 [Perkinsus olseni]